MPEHEGDEEEILCTLETLRKAPEVPNLDPI